MRLKPTNFSFCSRDSKVSARPSRSSGGAEFAHGPFVFIPAASAPRTVRRVRPARLIPEPLLGSAVSAFAGVRAHPAPAEGAPLLAVRGCAWASSKRLLVHLGHELRLFFDFRTLGRGLVAIEGAPIPGTCP